MVSSGMGHRVGGVGDGVQGAGFRKALLARYA